MTRKTDVSKALDQYVGNKIRWYRIRAGFSQQDLAEKLQISYQQLHKYESGSNSVSASRLSEISDILSISVEKFFDGYNGADLCENAASDPISKEHLQLMKYLQQIKDPLALESIAQLIHSLSKAPKH